MFAVHELCMHSGDWLEDGFITGQHAAHLRALMRKLLGNLRPHALPLVDAFALPDFMLASPLGRQDGEVYPALFAAINAAPRATGVPSYFQQLIRPLTDPAWSAAGAAAAAVVAGAANASALGATRE